MGRVFKKPGEVTGLGIDRMPTGPNRFAKHGLSGGAKVAGSGNTGLIKDKVKLLGGSFRDDVVGKSKTEDDGKSGFQKHIEKIMKECRKSK